MQMLAMDWHRSVVWGKDLSVGLVSGLKGWVQLAV
jgi:hypothetical protein